MLFCVYSTFRLVGLVDITRVTVGSVYNNNGILLTLV